MQTTPTITHLESRILSILRPGEMIRFVLIPDAKRRMEFGIEGASITEEGNALMADRLALVLGELRHDGYAFGGRMRKLSGVEARGSGRARSRRSPVWVEIRPRTLVAAPAPIGALGFTSTGASVPPRRSLRLPDLPPSVAGRTVEFPSALLAALPQVERFEIEFERRELPDAASKELEESLRTQVLAEQAVAQMDQATLPRVFLAYWLRHRTGWKVTARARLSGKAAPPVAALEMIGRDLFLSECEVVHRRVEESAGDLLDLGNVFPRGWPFPPILPPTAVLDSLTASRLHNISLPELPRTGMEIGTAEGVKVRLPLETRDRHTYIAGATGTGKTTLVGHMIADDLRSDRSVILLDPHGDLYHSVLAAVPRRRRHQVVCLDATRECAAFGLNVLDMPQGKFLRRHAAFVVGELLRFFEETWDMRMAGGPTFEMYFRNTLLLMCLQDPSPEGHERRQAAIPKPPSFDENEKLIRELSGEDSPTAEKPEAITLPLTFRSFTRVMVDKEFRKRLLAGCTDKSVVDFWTGIAEKTVGDYQLANFVPYISSKINSFTQTGFVADLVCAPRNDLRIGERMDRGEIVLVNLNKGLLGAYESRLLGTVLMMEIFAAGLQRSAVPVAKRRAVNVYVDEFQNFVSDNVASMLSEARKFGLRLTLANQTLGQLKANFGRQDLLETVLGNVGNMILFRLGVPDAERLKLFLEPFTRQEIQELPNFHALVRLLTTDGPVRPLIMRTLRPGMA